MITPAFERVMLVLPFITNSFLYLQAYKIWERQSHDDVSFITATISIASAVIWGYYGWVINSTPLMFSGTFAAVGFSIIVYLKLHIPSKVDNGWRWI
jgi:uncharacterized protein with PQ loop repeat